jgi:CRP-like cAMP-binding protein
MERCSKMRSNRNLTVVEKKMYPIYNPLINKIKRNSIANIESFLSNYKVISPQKVIEILSKNKILRMDMENRKVADYLSNKFNYFKNIKDEYKFGFLKLIPFLKFDVIKKDKTIIDIGAENNNLYIIFEGSVMVFREFKRRANKPLHKIRDYLKDLYNKDKERYDYIVKKNKNLDLNFDNIIKDDYEPEGMNKVYNFYYEELEEIGTFSEGYSFGEATLAKKTNREVVIKAVTDCKLLYLNKFDYNRILKTPEEKALEKKADKFIKNFPIFKDWKMEQLVKLFNYFIHEIHYKDDLIYKQNDPNEYLYFLEDGVVMQYANVSFSWFNEYIEYIKDFSNNLLDTLLNLKHKNIINNEIGDDIHIYINKKIEEIKKEYKKKKYKDKYPFLNINKIYIQRRKDLINNEIYRNGKNVENFMTIKNEEKDLNNPDNLYKIQISKNKIPTIFGIEEIFEVKNRLTTIECFSERVNLKKIKINDFLNVLYTYKHNDYIENFMELMIQRKSLLIDSIQTQTKKYGLEFQNKMEDKYEKIISNPKIMTIKEDKSIIVDEKLQDEAIISLRLKGWNNGLYLDNILDSNICLIKPGTKKRIKDEEEKRSKTLNFLYNMKNLTNEKKLKTTIYSFDKLFGKNQKSIKTSKIIKSSLLNLKSISIKQKDKTSKNFFKTNIPMADNERIILEKIKSKSIKNAKKRKINFFSKTSNNTNEFSQSNFPKPKKRFFKKMINYKISEENKDENNKEKIKSEYDYAYSNLNSGSLWTKSRDFEYLPSII